MPNEQSPSETKKKRPISRSPFAPRDFNVLRVLGKGGFGDVMLAKNKKNEANDDLYAVKVVDKGVVLEHGFVNQAVAEKQVMEIIDHPFIMKMRTFFIVEVVAHVPL